MNHLPSALLFLAGSLALKAQDRPNIVVFLTDDMGPMDTSVPFITDRDGSPVRYPFNDWYHTPAMERLASQGVRFSQFYAMSVSSPSRVSLLTGKYSARHHTTNWINSESDNRDGFGPYGWGWAGISEEEWTLPRMLASAGYRTIHVGKAHLGNNYSPAADPLNVGFDVNVAGSSIGEPGSYYGEDGYGLIKGYQPRAVPGLEKYHGTDTFLTEALTLEALERIDEAVEEDIPFFLYMSHYAVHTPHQTDPRFIGRYQADTTKPANAKGFATLIEGMDKSLGDILDHLTEKGIAGNTLVIFMGDNGTGLFLGTDRDHCSSAPLRGMKGTEFEGGIRVPSIVSWAEREDNEFQSRLPIMENGVRTEVTSICDIYPTLASVVGAKIPSDHPVDGQDISALLSGSKDKNHRDEFLMHFPHEHRGSYFTVWREGKWKLIYYYNPTHPEKPQCSLFNLKRDPFENKDLAARRPWRVRKMVKEMAKRLEEAGAQYPVDFTGTPISPGK
ncbi:MAG: sulfatase [Bacteroidales bacterium]|nr:sulfatase [Bacteroidales bacterium]